MCGKSEVEKTHTYFVGDTVETSVLVHNECRIHDSALFPDWLDVYLNASRNGLNSRIAPLFGQKFDVPVCTCKVARVSKPASPDTTTLGKLAANSPGGMSLENLIKATDQLAGYANNAADTLEAAQWELATVPLWMIGGAMADDITAATKALRSAGSMSKAGTSIKLRRNLNYSTKAAEHLKGAARFVPENIIKEGIISGIPTPDPRGSEAIMYYSRLWRNGKLYNFEVLYNHNTNTIWHCKYTPEAIGPFLKIPIL
ncbi:MAG: hypothetical protein ACRC2T_11385 [Thermoguttaceae bacterium]